MINTEMISKCMNMTEIREKAESLGISTEEKEKTELIHSVQIAENCTPCFGISDGQCTHAICCFMQDCLKVSLTESRKTEQHLRQQTSELTAEKEQLQRQVTEHKSTENELKQYRDQLEHRVAEESSELAEVNETLQHKMAECEQAQNELQECRKQFELHLKEKTAELKAAKKQLQREIAKRKQTEKRVVELQAKLANADFVIQKQLESWEKGSEQRKDSPFGLRSIAKLCGRICGLLANTFQL
jgi:DNA repair exonuclease SbcCD ATPase subunit